MKKRLTVLVCLVASAVIPFSTPAAGPNDLEFLEAFAWGDRAAALKELVPNTDDYFYFHGLHYQLAGDRVAFQKNLDAWLTFRRNNWSRPMEELRRRQLLLDFDRAPEDAWEYLINDLNLTFNHRPRHEQQAARLPSRLRPEQYGFDVFLRDARRFGQLLDNLTACGLELAADNENPGFRRALLGRIERPDFPNLVEMIRADLDYREPNGNVTAFGQFNIHRRLTRAQLEELGRRRPALLREEAYVMERLAHIPPPDTDLSHDHAAAVKHFEEVWAFVAELEPMHNSLKASVLYRLLDHQRRLSVYDEARFREYLALPRPVPYLPQPRREALQRQATNWVNFNYRAGRDIVLPPIGNEEPLVRDFLIELLKTANDTSRYNEFFEARWLDAIFAESKILHGVGRPEEWASRLTPTAYRAILDRIELNFALQNSAYVKPGQPIELKVDVKRVDEIRIKVFEIQTFNYYTTHRRPVDQAVDLDGLTATYERTLKTAADPARRVRHTLALPEITRRGVYVVELIGNGISSRALLHVGRLESVSLPTPFGQAILVLNDAGETVKNAAVWLDGREFSANQDGLVLLPFSENPGVRFAVLRDGDFCSPEQIRHLGEEYSFSAGIHLDPQNLPRRNTALLMLRPDFRIHGIPLDPALLGQVKIVLAATDAKGTRTERVYTAEFARNAEWSRAFYVPDALRKLDVRVEAKIKRKTDLKEITLTDSFALDVNGARAGDTRRQVFLVPSDEGWSLEVRGLTGEPIKGVPLQVSLRHPGFNRTVDLQVSTDDAGRVDLGPLTALSHITVTGPDNLRLERALMAGAAALPARLHLKPGEAVSLPYPFERRPDLRALSLFQVKGETILADVSEKAKIQDGEVRIEGLAAGEYALTLHETGTTVSLEVLDGESRAGYLLGRTRRLQETANRLPSVADVKREGDAVIVRLRNATPGTRVAARAFRYADGGSDFPAGGGFAPPVQRHVFPPYMQYVSGRNIGDEYRYVLERQSRDVFAGTLLERPGLILNPWELRETEAEREQLREGEAYRGERQRLAEAAESRRAEGPAAMRGLHGGRPAEVRPHESAMPISRDIGYDFLPRGARWWVNLKPDKDGVVKIPLADLAEHTALDIVVLDRFGTSRVRYPLTDGNFQPKDLRLTAGLSPDGLFSRQKKIQVLAPNKPVVFSDLATTRYQTIRTLGQAFDLLQTLSGDAALVEFAFLKEWPKLDDATKLKKYGEYACHELHLFLHERDRAFFDRVVRPYLANKKDKTFVDRWLLGTLTPEDTRLDRLQDRNALELALLARRGGAAGALRAMLREAWELLPPDPDGFARRVRTALQSAELDETQATARARAREEARIGSEILAGARGRAVLGDRMAARMREPDAEMAADTAFAEKSPAAPPRPSRPPLSMALRESDDRMAKEDGGDALLELADAPAEEMKALLGGEATRLYRALPKTKEWAEQNYYKVRVKDDVPGRIPVNGFWLDVANGAAVPERLLEAHRNLTEVIAALAFCGLPWEADAPEERTEGARLTLTVKTPALLVTEQILPAKASADDRPLLLSQQFFRPDDMYRYEGNERIEKFVTGEFIRRVVYGARVTLTNPTASRRRLNVLLQIPMGAVPLRNSAETDDVDVLLEPYTTRTIEFFFTFPFASGAAEFAQFPPHAAAAEAIIGRAEPRAFRVVDAPTEVDKTSWAWVSQYASPEDTLAFLRDNNIRRLDLNEIAWRMRDRGFFEQTTDLLTARGIFHDTLFSYALHHRDIERAKIYLARSPLRDRVGRVLESPLLTVNPVETKVYEHLEYDPLVNARAHPVGEKRKILNTALNEQYRAFLSNGLYRATLNANERLALCYYLLLQDRLAEAITEMAKIREAELHEKIQWDYLRAWVALRMLEPDRAFALAQPHQEYPVPRWRERFRSVAAAVAEARGAPTAVAQEPSRQQDLDRLAADTPSLELKVENGKLWVTAHRLPRITLNLYPMDIELMFSRKPFLAEGGADFAVIKPAFTQELEIKAKGEPEEIRLPRGYAERNLMVEVTGKGQRAGTAWFASRLRVRKMESYGQVEVRSARDNAPLPKTYVKVFARGVDGRETFWKDGYTDLRGRFDYVSLNDRKPEEAAEFAILILHPELGAEIRTAKPPPR